MKSMSEKAICLLTMLAVLITAQAAQAGDWPMFRHDAAHSGVADEVIEPPLELVWKYEVGSTAGSPSIYNGVMYVSSWDRYTNEGFVYALDATTGSLKWKYKTGNEPIQSTPSASGSLVYVGGDNYVYALDTNTGSLKWKYQTSGRVIASPTISGNMVYIGSEDFNLYAIDAQTGTLKWKYITGSIIYSSPAIFGDTLYMGSEDRYIYAINANTGNLKWKYETGGIITVSSPVISENNVYIGSTDNYIYALDAGTGGLKWKYQTSGPIDSSPAVYNNVLYVGSKDKYIYALDAQTGTLKWKYETNGINGWYSFSPVVSGNVVYAGPEDGYLYALDADTGSIKWKYKTNSWAYFSPAFSKNMVYVGLADGYVYAFAPVPTPAPAPLSVELTPSIPHSTPAPTPTLTLTPAKTSVPQTPSAATPTLLPTSKPTKEPTPELPYPTNWALIGGAILVILVIGTILLRKRKPKDKSTNVAEEPMIDKKSVLKDINITSAFGYKGATILYKVKFENTSPAPIADIKVSLFVPNVFLLLEKEKSLALLKPGESKTVTFDIRPTGECGDCEVSGKVAYYDTASNRTKEIDIESKMLSIVCPMLKVKEINEAEWHNIVSNLLETEESTKEIDMSADTLFNMTSRIIKDMHMHMLKPEVTHDQKLFNGVARFYCEGIKGLRYAAQIEVVGGARKSKLILKAWAEKEDALTGFYHGVLDEIEKRVKVKEYIDDSIVQYNVHIGDKIGTLVKDSVVQRSTIGASARKCPNCGREVEANEKFCLECGAKLS